MKKKINKKEAFITILTLILLAPTYLVAGLLVLTIWVNSLVKIPFYMYRYKRENPIKSIIDDNIYHTKEVFNL